MSAPCLRCRAELGVFDIADGRRCAGCHDRAFERSFNVLLADQPPSLRLTARGQNLVAVLLIACLFGGLLAAYRVGQDRRCDALREQDSPLAATYCPGATATTGGGAR